MKLLTVIMMLFFVLIIGSSAFATTPDLELREQAENISSVLEQNAGRKWAWDVVRVRTQLEVGIEIPVITKFSLNPEVELFFVKK